MNERRQWLVRILLGGLAGMAVLLPLGLLFNDLVNGGLISMGGFRWYWISPDLAWRLGGAQLPALVIQLVLYFALGAAVGVSTLPFADDGRTLVLRSLTHFAVTAGLFSLLGWLCGWAYDIQALLLYIALLAAVYLLIWLARWVGWYAEVSEIRARLGLSSAPSFLKWRETLTYLPFSLLVCILLPALLRWIDLTFVVDVPVFSGLIYPFLLLPVAGLCSGISLGKRQGFCPLYPIACFLLYLPMVFLLYNSSALFHCFVIGITALAGNCAGALWGKLGTRNEE